MTKLSYSFYCLLSLCLVGVNGYAFSTNQRTTTGAAPFGGAQVPASTNNGQAVQTTDAVNGVDREESIVLQQPLTAATSTTTTATTTIPNFSGFGHAIPQTLASTVSPSPAPTPTLNKPVFSGFAHAIPKNNSNNNNNIMNNSHHQHSRKQWLPFSSAFGLKRPQQSSNSQLVSNDNHDNRKNGIHHSDNHDNLDTEISISMDTFTDPDLMEASKMLSAARDKVQLLKQELEQKARQQSMLVQELREELKSQSSGYEARLERLADQFQEYKFAAHRDKLELLATLKLKEDAIRAEAAIREEKLRLEISNLEQQLAEATKEVQVAQELNVQLQQKYQALQTNFTDLRQMYMEDQMDWEDRLEMEQNARQKDRALAESVLRQAQEEAARKLRLARMDGTVQVETIKSEFNNRLYHKETLLQSANTQLERASQDKEVLEEKLEELQAQSTDLSALTKQTAKVATHVAKSKATSTLQKAKNFFRRANPLS